jgi:hypothetical protein
LQENRRPEPQKRQNRILGQAQSAKPISGLGVLHRRRKTLEFSLRSPFDLMVNLQDHSGWLAFLNTVRTERFDDIMCLTSRIRAFPAA